MPPATFGMFLRQEDAIKELYPNWPMVELGRSVHRETGHSIQALPLPQPLNNVELKGRVDVGRLELQRLLECNVESICGVMLASDSNHVPHETSEDFQVKMTNDDNPTILWKITDHSAKHQNVGCVKIDGEGDEWRLYNDKGKSVYRLYDPIISVLESLSVGRIGADGMKWERPRTINATVHPQGPNVYFEAWRDRRYEFSNEPDPHAAIHAFNNAFYNAFDGAILVTALNWWGEPGLEHPHIPSLTWCEPRHVIWYCWHALHAGTAPLDFDGGQFPSENLEPPFYEPVSGRKQSAQRGSSQYYHSIKSTQGTVLPQMTSFLNYVSFSGSAIVHDDVAVIRACLSSRQTDNSQAPVWGYHETFQIGHWAFYALLATAVGTELTKLLYEHKAPHELGKKIVRSITVYAADCYFSETPAGVEDRILAKWPVLLFHIGDFDEDIKRCGEEIEAMYTTATNEHRKLGNTYLFPPIGFPQLPTAANLPCPRIVLPSSMTWGKNEMSGNKIFTDEYTGSRLTYF